MNEFFKEEGMLGQSRSWTPSYEGVHWEVTSCKISQCSDSSKLRFKNWN